MNNKIKKLAEEAGFMLWGEETWNPGDAIDWSARYDTELEKFADLIVKECSDVAHKCILEDGSDFPLKSVAYRIKEHFGVE